MTNAFTTIKPSVTFATLNADADYVRLAVSPGVINKHFTAEQLRVLASLIEEDGALKYSASYYVLLSVRTMKKDAALRALAAVNLYVAPSGQGVDVKACDFCDGERLEALAITKQLYEVMQQENVPRRVHINMNGCASACYNATYDDIGIVYQHQSYDVYIGAVPMGVKANAGKRIAKALPENTLIAYIQRLLNDYKMQAREDEPLHKYVRRMKLV